MTRLNEHVQQPAQPAIRQTMGTAEWVMLLVLGAIWGGSFSFARIAVSEIPPLTLVFLRVAIAGAALQLYLLARGPSFALAIPHLPMLFLLALLNNVIPFSLIFLGQTALGAGLASVLNATTPFWTIVIANAVTSDEKLSWNKVSGVPDFGEEGLVRPQPTSGSLFRIVLKRLLNSSASLGFLASLGHITSPSVS